MWEWTFGGQCNSNISQYCKNLVISRSIIFSQSWAFAYLQLLILYCYVLLQQTQKKYHSGNIIILADVWNFWQESIRCRHAYYNNLSANPYCNCCITIMNGIKCNIFRQRLSQWLVSCLDITINNLNDSHNKCIFIKYFRITKCKTTTYWPYHW